MLQMPRKGAPMSDDYAGNATTTGVISVSDSVTGNIETANDEDWFQVTLTAGVSYRIELDGSSGGGGTLTDPFVSIYDPNQNILTSDNNSGGGLDSRIFYGA